MNSIITPASGILLLPTCTGIQVIPISNIVRIEAISNYSKLFFCPAIGGSKTLVVAKVLKWFDALLADKGFIRIHRSHLINLSCINSYHHHTNYNRHKIILHNNEQINIARRKRSSITKRLAIMPAA